MRASLLFLLTCSLSLSLTAQKMLPTAENTPLSIVPQPAKLIRTDGVFALTNRSQIIVPNGDTGFRRVAQLLADRLKLDGTKVSVIDLNASKSTANVIFFIKIAKNEVGTEGYKLTVTPDRKSVV